MFLLDKYLDKKYDCSFVLRIIWVKRKNQYYLFVEYLSLTNESFFCLNKYLKYVYIVWQHIIKVHWSRHFYFNRSSNICRFMNKCICLLSTLPRALYHSFHDVLSSVKINKKMSINFKCYANVNKKEK